MTNTGKDDAIAMNAAMVPEMVSNMAPEMAIDASALDIFSNPEAHPDFTAIRDRFYEPFMAFTREQKLLAAVDVAREELEGSLLSDNEDFVAKIAARIQDEALLEKRFVFISVNRELVGSV